MRGEGLCSSEHAHKILKRRELKIGGEGCDITLPGESDAFGQTMQEYVPLLFLAIETTRLAMLRRLAPLPRPNRDSACAELCSCTHRLLELGVDANAYFHGQPPIGAAVELASVDMMRILLSHGGDVTLPWVTAAGKAVLAPLHAAAEQGQVNGTHRRHID